MRIIMYPILCVLSLIYTIPMSFWTQNNASFWIGYFQHKVVEVPYWAAFVVTLLVNVAWVPINVIASILRLFV